MADNGLKRYSVQESHNVTLGQLGFDTLGSTTLSTSETGNWVAIKAIGEDIPITAATTSIGDNLHDVQAVSLTAGDIIFGAFTSISCGVIPARAALLAYRG